jgi:hypothetical protein
MKDLTLNNRLIHIYNFRAPGETLGFQLKSLAACLETGMVVLDANVLLLPLATGALTLSEIERVYKSLIDQDRLFVPTHALREYLANRPTKIKELIDQLVKKKDNNYSSSSSPLLQKAAIFEELTTAEKSLQLEVGKVSKILARAIKEIKEWETNDPVSALYRGLNLSARLISDPVDFESEKDIKEFLEENDQRQENKIPPGYKDSRKAENDIGDFLIWKTVLRLGSMHPGRDLTFVSGEIKTDWIYKSSGQSLHVREELIEEYRKHSAGGSFHLIDLATLLKEFKASDEVVNEVRSSEIIASLSAAKDNGAELETHNNWPEFVETSLKAVTQWLREECDMINVVTAGGAGNRLTATLDDEKFLIYVRPIRHVEHIARRLRELQIRLEKDIAVFAEFSPPVRYRGSVIFVCENKFDAVNVANFLESSKHEDYVWVSGYMANGRFIGAMPGTVD